MITSRVSLGRTINMGNYESLRLEVTVEVTDPKETIDQLVERAEIELDTLIPVLKRKYK